MFDIVLEITVIMDTQCQRGKSFIVSKISQYVYKLCFSYSQAPSRECASYPHEQCSNSQQPRYQTNAAQDSAIPYNAYYSTERGF